MAQQIGLFGPEEPVATPKSDAPAPASPPDTSILHGRHDVPLFAVSLTQPWSSLMAFGEKRLETRSWSTQHQGPLAIHASKGFPRDERELCEEEPFRSALARHGLAMSTLPLGVIIGIVELRRCGRTTLWSLSEADVEFRVAGTLERATDTVRVAGNEFAFGDYSTGRFAWETTSPRPLAVPIPARGMLGLWRIPDEIRAQIAAATVRDAQ